MDTFTGVQYHHDQQFITNRRKMLDACANLSTTQLKRQVDYLRSNPEVPTDDTGVQTRMLGELRGAAYTPDFLKAILDSTGGGTSGGSVMIRQDLEVPLYQLFIKS